jgi:hypothetical protein
MNILSRDKQIEIIAALCEGVGQRAAARLADVDRKTIARLALQVGKGCAEPLALIASRQQYSKLSSVLLQNKLKC